MSNLVQQTATLLARTPSTLLKNSHASTWPRVLVCSVRYHYIGSPIEMILAHALRLHKAQVDVILCDQLMPACDHRNIDHNTPEACQTCQRDAAELFTAAGLPIHYLGHFFNQSRLARLETQVAAIPRDELLETVYLGVNVGRIAYASTLRHFLRGRLVDDAQWAKFREFLVTAMLMAEVSREILKHLQPEAIIISHGIYVTWGVIAEYARQQGVRVTVYGYGYRRNSILVSQDVTYHHDLLVEPVTNWCEQSLTGKQRKQIVTYLQSRVNGALDWISYHPHPNVNRQDIAQQLGLDPAKLTVGMFTNLAWDAAVLFRSATFPDMYTWVTETIRWALNQADLQLVIRCHPAEVKRKSITREKIADVIRAEFPQLPPHIKIIPAESNLSTYTLSELLDLTVVYSSKVGLEFAARGLLVVVAGEAFYREKGFTEDPTTAIKYFERLNRIQKDKRLSPLQQELALRYAYHYFFRRHITLDYFADHGIGQSITHFKLDNLSTLAPGYNVTLDHFCEMILQGEADLST